jgi:hypothetical protein
MVTSVYPSADGTPTFMGGGSLFNSTDHRTPFGDRWGGWYVSGTHGKQRHLGNAIIADPSRPFELEQQGTQNLTDLAGKFETSKYPVPTSDIVALMTLEHQTTITNLLTSLNAQAKASTSGAFDAKARARLDQAVESTVTYLLFADEAPLAEPIHGVSTFTETFPRRGPRDGRGRSLRDFDLQTRLFRFPLSYMVYSEAFDALPAPLRERIYQRLYDVLAGKDTRGAFSKLSSDRRRAALEILRDTKPGLPEYWHTDAAVAAARKP